MWSGGTVPISGGPSVEGAVENKGSVSWEGSSDFVFAFRVRKVLVEKKTGAVKSDEDYKDGAMLERKLRVVEVPRLSILTEEDPDAEEEGFIKEELMEGDVIVNCAVPYPLNHEDDDI